MIFELIKEYCLILKGIFIEKDFVDFPKEWKKGEKGTVLILQGIHEKPNFLKTIAKRLHEKGFGILTIYSQKETEETIAYLGEKSAKAIDNLKSNTIFLLAHSKGGLVAKYLMDNYPEINKRINIVITIACPWSGSYLGLARFHNLSQLIPGSIFIKELLKNITNNYKIVNLYPTFDNHVIPNKNLVLEGAKNICIPVIGHTRILEDERTLKEIAGEILRFASE